MILASALLCLSMNIYYEAGNEPPAAQMAVAFVTLNRAKYKQENICSVVFAPHQFSWTNDMKAIDQPSGKAWENSKKTALKILRLKNPGEYDFTSGATHYYADYIPAPKWVYNMEFIGKYGVHLFYKEG